MSMQTVFKVMVALSAFALSFEHVGKQKRNEYYAVLLDEESDIGMFAVDDKDQDKSDEGSLLELVHGAAETTRLVWGAQ